VEWNTTLSTPVVERSYILRRSAMEGVTYVTRDR
jgi:hypothetical protein